jgi:hypothetical protein
MALYIPVEMSFLDLETKQTPTKGPTGSHPYPVYARGCHAALQEEELPYSEPQFGYNELYILRSRDCASHSATPKPTIPTSDDSHFMFSLSSVRLNACFLSAPSYHCKAVLLVTLNNAD